MLNFHSKALEIQKMSSHSLSNMTPEDLKLLDMIRYKNKGSHGPICEEGDYREAAKKANVNAFNSDNFRQRPTQVFIALKISGFEPFWLSPLPGKDLAPFSKPRSLVYVCMPPSIILGVRGSAHIFFQESFQAKCHRSFPFFHFSPGMCFQQSADVLRLFGQPYCL